MNPRKITVKALEANGYSLKRHGANHDVYFNPETKKNHSTQASRLQRNDMRYIFKEADIKKDKS